MHLCNDGHDEVCYEGRDCPVCLVKADLEEANGKIAELEKQIERLEEEDVS